MNLPQYSKEINQLINKNLDKIYLKSYNYMIWQPNTLYRVGDMVNYNDLTIVCKENHTSGKEFEDKFWNYVSKKEFY